MEGEESLSGQLEAVVRLQLAFGEVDEDAFLQIEQLENGQGSLALPRERNWAQGCQRATSTTVSELLGGWLGSAESRSARRLRFANCRVCMIQ